MWEIIVGLILGTILAYALGLGPFSRKPAGHAKVDKYAQKRADYLNNPDNYFLYHGMFGDVHAIRIGSCEHFFFNVTNVFFWIMLLIILSPILFWGGILLVAIIGGSLGLL